MKLDSHCEIGWRQSRAVMTRAVRCHSTALPPRDRAIAQYESSFVANALGAPPSLFIVAASIVAFS